VLNKFYLPLLLYGEGGDSEGNLQEGEAQLMMGRMLHTLQDLTLFVNRISELVLNMVQQMASLYSPEGLLRVINANGIHLQTVFEHIGHALGILITLDHIFSEGTTFREHWNQYKRIITSIRGAPTEYGVDETKLKPFEKLLQTLEGKLMEGQIFTVCWQLDESSVSIRARWSNFNKYLPIPIADLIYNFIPISSYHCTVIFKQYLIIVANS